MRKLKLLFSLVLLQTGFCLKAQSVDSSSVTYKNDTLTIHIEGKVPTWDHKALKRISDTTIGDSVLVDVFFLPCSPFQTFAPYDTTFNITGPFATGINYLRLYTILNADTIGSCYQYPNDQIVDTVNFAFNVPLSTEQLVKQKLDIYPNPSSDKIFIESPTKVSMLQMINSTGALIKSWNAPQFPVDVADLPKGIYFFKVKTLEGIALSRFVKL